MKRLIAYFGILSASVVADTISLGTQSPAPVTPAAGELRQLAQPAAAEKQPTTPARVAQPVTPPAWSYRVYREQMTGRDEKHAIAASNHFELKWPYGGLQHARLDVRNSPKFGLDVMVSVEKGQILCPVPYGCKVAVRFDDGPIIKVAALPSSDYSSDTIFVKDANSFLAKLAKA